jgi:hypothetical protein
MNNKWTIMATNKECHGTFVRFYFKGETEENNMTKMTKVTGHTHIINNNTMIHLFKEFQHIRIVP